MKPNSNERAEFPTGKYRLPKIIIDTYTTNQHYGKGITIFRLRVNNFFRIVKAVKNSFNDLIINFEHFFKSWKTLHDQRQKKWSCISS